MMDFLSGVSQVVKDVSDRRALRFEVSLGNSAPPIIRVNRTSLTDTLSAFQQKIVNMRAELAAVRQSLAAAQWVLVDSSSIASIPPSSRSLSVESTTPPVIQSVTYQLP